MNKKRFTASWSINVKLPNYNLVINLHNLNSSQAEEVV